MMQPRNSCGSIDKTNQISGCAIIGFINEDGSLSDGTDIINGISAMHERSNGLGGGFQLYGCYPEMADFYAFHIMYDNKKSMDETEAYLEEHFNIELKEILPHEHISAISAHPLIRRYFIKPRQSFHQPVLGEKFEEVTDDEYVARAVFNINANILGATVFSSGKNCGTFKAVGYPEDIGKFFKLKDYEAYCWMAHGRFPTNSQAHWGGAHPFSLLNISVVHNGEISSYGINKRYLENFGYQMTAGTDTEVLAYLFDLFTRKQKLSFETAADILGPPFWNEIEHMPKEKQDYYRKLRIIYGSALCNGPFGIVVGFEGGMLGLNDRIKLRPLVAARGQGRLYLGSEECAIREANSFRGLDKLWYPRGGEMVMARLKNGHQGGK